MVPYKHEPFTNFAMEENKKAFQDALAYVQTQLGKEYPLVIGGEYIETKDKVVSINPANKEEVIGSVSMADQELAEKAMQAALTTFETWKKWKPEHRANILFRAAAIMRRRKHEFSAYLVKEAGKPWKEADADTAEAIDFLEFYARQMLKLKDGIPVNSREGEFNQFHYIPLGVGIIISPFNFPLAIMAGTTVAAIVSGNTVLLKPANSTPVIAAKFVELMEEAGLPAGVLNFVPGSGSQIGDYLVDHPKTRFVSFTGSREVGCRIYERAAKVHPGQIWLKRVIAEMGGKNAIIVDDDADLDEAVLGVIHSAFNYAGQKCSACSRVIVLESIHDTFVDRLIEATKSLKIGPAEDPGTIVGPVIDEEAKERILEYIEIGKEEATLALACDTSEFDDEGTYVGPHIFTDVDSTCQIAQEEIFGPVLAVLKAEDFDEAITIANDTPYALTAGLYSRSPAHLQRACRELVAGNIYLNRNITGAMVERHPFGGFKMSGLGSKTVGPDYLLQFLVPVNVTENTMRRGFAPDAAADDDDDE